MNFIVDILVPVVISLSYMGFMIIVVIELMKGDL